MKNNNDYDNHNNIYIYIYICITCGNITKAYQISQCQTNNGTPSKIISWSHIFKRCVSLLRRCPNYLCMYTWQRICITNIFNARHADYKDCIISCSLHVIPNTKLTYAFICGGCLNVFYLWPNECTAGDSNRAESSISYLPYWSSAGAIKALHGGRIFQHPSDSLAEGRGQGAGCSSVRYDDKARYKP